MIFTDSEFRLFSHLIYNESGISIKDAKRDFLRAQLQKRLQVNRLNSYYRYYKLITDKTQGKRELFDLIDSLMINETSFFRDKPQFDLFTDIVVPELNQKKAREKKIRCWSAGCSRGQEAYSIAMSVLTTLKSPATWDIKILASDISLRLLDSAQNGRYSENEIETVFPEYQKEFFEKVSSHYQIKPSVRRLVIFDFHNLKHDNGVTGLDVIFCRNVMIYFDRDEQKRLIDKFQKSLADGGFLFLGHTESLQGLSDKFKLLYLDRGAVYQKVA